MLHQLSLLFLLPGSEGGCSLEGPFKDIGIPGYNYKTLTDVSVDDCLEACRDANVFAFSCKSVDINLNRGLCYLNSVRREDVAAIALPNYEFYEVTCKSEPTADESSTPTEAVSKVSSTCWWETREDVAVNTANDHYEHYFTKATWHTCQKQCEIYVYGKPCVSIAYEASSEKCTLLSSSRYTSQLILGTGSEEFGEWVCSDDANYHSERQCAWGKNVTGMTIANHNVHGWHYSYFSIEECKEACRRELACKSIDYQLDVHECRLNYIDDMNEVVANPNGILLIANCFTATDTTVTFDAPTTNSEKTAAGTTRDGKEQEGEFGNEGEEEEYMEDEEGSNEGEDENDEEEGEEEGEEEEDEEGGDQGKKDDSISFETEQTTPEQEQTKKQSTAKSSPPSTLQTQNIGIMTSVHQAATSSHPTDTTHMWSTQEISTSHEPIFESVENEIEIDVWTSWTECHKRDDQNAPSRFRIIICSSPDVSTDVCTNSLEMEPTEQRDINVTLYYGVATEECEIPFEPTWTEWAEWASCSSTCGVGFMARRRRCIKPLTGAHQCLGDETEINQCSKKECDREGEQQSSSILRRQKELLPVEVFTESDSAPSHIAVSLVSVSIIFGLFAVIILIDVIRIVQQVKDVGYTNFKSFLRSLSS